ncbi:related to D.melanogaster heat shock protein 67B2 [Rhynchosporium agropyri]|uniref:Related to D.melanogaster heat shock protein 67B2 n=1 Tax=Rhynchosporium agropyri TaxID=914238 RepID=A0A1E1K2Q1_9HELO|nr:related to D.melanogaster heat shock protein 67B2 [Rhynchosporium agropyri]
MSALRSLIPVFTRAAKRSILQANHYVRLQPMASVRTISAIGHAFHARLYSQEAQAGKIYSFDEVKAFVEKPDPNRVLIDSREPGEVQTTGTIPGSLNIPVTSKPDSFFISGEEFEDRFGFERPSKDQELVFYCKSGVRSRAAASLARQAGWGDVAEYQGSWLDWDKNGGVKEGSRQ